VQQVNKLIGSQEESKVIQLEILTNSRQLVRIIL
jgi:hypothetical protein